MNAGATSERVYDGLKRRLLSGCVPPGGRLEPALIADGMASSVTPVRDALHRLIGERIVEAHSGTGFQLAALNEPDLRDLYAWNAQVLLDAVRWWPVGRARAVPEPSTDPVEDTRHLFRLFGERGDNREIVAAIDSISDRLTSARLAETLAIGSAEVELAALRNALERDAIGDIGKIVRAYHRKRLLAVPAILRSIYRAH